MRGVDERPPTWTEVAIVALLVTFAVGYVWAFAYAVGKAAQ